MKLFEDILCILLLLLTPDFLLNKLGLYNSIETIIKNRMESF